MTENEAVTVEKAKFLLDSNHVGNSAVTVYTHEEKGDDPHIVLLKKWLYKWWNEYIRENPSDLHYETLIALINYKNKRRRGES